MSKSYKEITQSLMDPLGKMHKESPDVMKAFTAIANAAKKDGALNEKTKELIALAIGVAVKCDGCIGFHAKALVRLGATRDEVMETLGMCVYMGGGPSVMIAADALKAFEEFSQ